MSEFKRWSFYLAVLVKLSTGEVTVLPTIRTRWSGTPEGVQYWRLYAVLGLSTGDGCWGNAPDLVMVNISPDIIFRLITITPIPNRQYPVPFTVQ
ncbi:hypothetical protein SD81_019045 [Tolypothrix campylonemoides VB511288]|nr:hypothetical protein SD81_019045 [Tolypothrix campylonemoides VB511288]